MAQTVMASERPTMARLGGYLFAHRARLGGVRRDPIGLWVARIIGPGIERTGDGDTLLAAIASAVERHAEGL